MRRAGPLAALVIGLSLGGAIGCSSTPGTTTTAYGPRPTAEVVAQDTVVDVLKTLEDGYKTAVIAHDARAATEDPLVHAAHRALLIKEHDALVAAATTLIAWKQAAGSSYSPASVIQPLVAALPDDLKLAVELGALTQAQADKILAYAKAMFPTILTDGGTSRYLVRVPGRPDPEWMVPTLKIGGLR